jgi:hypothetical protein
MVIVEPQDPIIGDDKYFHAEPDWDFPCGMQNKLHLHARRLIVPHPSGKGVIDVSAPLPHHMQQSWNLLGLDPALGEADDDDGTELRPGRIAQQAAKRTSPTCGARRRRRPGDARPQSRVGIAG